MDKDDTTVHKRKSHDIDVEAAGGNVGTTGALKDIIYRVEDRPPWHLCILLGFQNNEVSYFCLAEKQTNGIDQLYIHITSLEDFSAVLPISVRFQIGIIWRITTHYLTMFGSTYTIPILLYKEFCMADDTVGLSELFGTIFFVSGLCTIIQTIFGVRLPIVQGATFAFLAPTLAILQLRECKYMTIPKANWTSAGLPEVGSDAHREDWQSRIAEVQGCIMVASLFQIFIGFSGLVGLMLRFISPIVIAPTITLIGVSLFEAAADKASKHWWIAITTIVLIAIFSQYLRDVSIPLPTFNRKKGCTVWKLEIFKLFPVLLGIVVSWVICVILTESGALTDNPDEWGYAARTDANNDVLWKSKWFRFPYPGQWGVPTVSAAGVFGILAGVLASMIESVGDYYACARLSGAPPPPVHAVNRGIGVEGIGCLLAGAWGSGNGTTSYSENIGAIGITKVASRLVVQVGAIIMILLGCLGKVGALFVTIPEPVVGGVFIVMFGMIMAIGISNLQFVDLNSSRNLFIVGLAMLFGLAFPFWLKKKENASAVSVGHETADQIILVLLSTSMFVGGSIAFVLDVTLPGTDEERGLKTWRMMEGTTALNSDEMKIYDLPLIQPFLNRLLCTKYLPFCPHFDGFCSCGSKRDKQREVSPEAQNTNPTFEEDDTETRL